MRIAEIGRAVGADESVERVGGQCIPGGIGQIRAGFHYDDQIAAPGDVKSKMIRSHAKAGAAVLRLRVPQLG